MRFQALDEEIRRKQGAMNELTEIASALMDLVGDDEAAVLADKLTETTDRYTALADASEAVRLLLESSRSGLRHLVLTYQDLQNWMEDMEQRLNRHRVLAVHTDRLEDQMEDLAVSFFAVHVGSKRKSPLGFVCSRQRLLVGPGQGNPEQARPGRRYG